MPLLRIKDVSEEESLLVHVNAPRRVVDELQGSVSLDSLQGAVLLLKMNETTEQQVHKAMLEKWTTILDSAQQAVARARKITKAKAPKQKSSGISRPGQVEGATAAVIADNIPAPTAKTAAKRTAGRGQKRKHGRGPNDDQENADLTGLPVQSPVKKRRKGSKQVAGTTDEESDASRQRSSSRLAASNGQKLASQPIATTTRTNAVGEAESIGDHNPNPNLKLNSSLPDLAQPTPDTAVQGGQPSKSRGKSTPNTNPGKTSNTGKTRWTASEVQFLVDWFHKSPEWKGPQEGDTEVWKEITTTFNASTEKTIERTWKYIMAVCRRKKQICDARGVAPIED